MHKEREREKVTQTRGDGQKQITEYDTRRRHGFVPLHTHYGSGHFESQILNSP